MEMRHVARIALEMLENAVLVILLERKNGGNDLMRQSLTMTQISKQLGISAVMDGDVLTHHIVPEVVLRCESKGYVTRASKQRWKITDVGEIRLQTLWKSQP